MGGGARNWIKHREILDESGEVEFVNTLCANIVAMLCSVDMLCSVR